MGILIYCSKIYFKKSRGLEKGYSLNRLDLEMELPYLKVCRIPPPCVTRMLELFSGKKQLKNKTVPRDCVIIKCKFPFVF